MEKVRKNIIGKGKPTLKFHALSNHRYLFHFTNTQVGKDDREGIKKLRTIK